MVNCGYKVVNGHEAAKMLTILHVDTKETELYGRALMRFLNLAVEGAVEHGLKQIVQLAPAGVLLGF
jgi:hypothetical protein